MNKMRHDRGSYNVTLLSRDNRVVSGHRDILMLNSDYFQKILKVRREEPHPVIKVDQATRDELNLMMDFIYNGQVLVSQEQLETFIKLGHLFKLKGMVDEKYTVDLNTSVEDEDIDCVVILGLDDVNQDVKRSPERKDIFSYAREPNQSVKEDLQDFSSEVYERIERKKIIGGRPDYTIVYRGKLTSKHELKFILMEYYSTTEVGLFKCNVCAKDASNSSHIREHVQSHMDDLYFVCDGCGKQLKTAARHRSHLSLGKCFPEPKREATKSEVKEELEHFSSAFHERIEGKKPQDRKDILSYAREPPKSVVKDQLQDFPSEVHERIERKKIVRPNYTIVYQGKLTSKHELNSILGEYFTKTQLGVQCFKCNVCDKDANNLHHIREHVQFHMQDLHFECDGCKKQLPSSSRHRQHLNTGKCSAYI